MFRHFTLVVALCCVVVVTAQDKSRQEQQRGGRCANILPYYEMEGGVRFDTSTLFEFVDALPSGRGREYGRALVSSTRERCGLMDAKNNHVEEATMRFRAACYMVKQTFAYSRVPPPKVDGNGKGNEAAVRVAMKIANDALRNAWQSCDVMCPCFNHGTNCSTMKHENRGDCVAPKAIPIDTQQQESGLVSMEIVVQSSPNVVAEPMVMAASIEPELITPEPPSPSLMHESTTPAVVVVVQITPEPITVQSTTEQSRGVANNEIAASASATASNTPPRVKVEVTPVALSDTTTELVGKRGISVGMIVGIGVGCVAIVTVLALFATSQIAFRRRHSEEIDQWRNAFRVVED